MHRRDIWQDCKTGVPDQPSGGGNHTCRGEIEPEMEAFRYWKSAEPISATSMPTLEKQSIK
jgi:hypothetical protein